jgi:hypothetical protein
LGTVVGGGYIYGDGGRMAPARTVALAGAPATATVVMAAAAATAATAADGKRLTQEEAR